MRKTLLLLLLLTVGFAQKPAPQTPAPAPQVHGGTAVQNLQVNDVELLKRDVAKLRNDLQDLRKQVDQLSKSLSTLQSAVPHCEGSTSVRGGVKQNCSPYVCDNGTGLCKDSCTYAGDCTTLRCNAEGRCRN